MHASDIIRGKRSVVPAIVAGVAAAVARPAAGDHDLRITKVVADGREVAAAGGTSGTVRVPAPCGWLEIHFEEREARAGADDPVAPTPAASGHRLRYRLDGIDDAWRDPPARARTIIQFVDESGDRIDNVETAVLGESPSWRGEPERSEFVPRQLTAVAPPRAGRFFVNFLSHGGDEVVGSIGIDGIEAAVQRAGAAEPLRHRLAITMQRPDDHPLASPAGWTRRGSRGDMALVRTRSGPEPHPILVLLDDAPDRYGNWSMLEGIGVQPGDRVTLSWEAAHSLGVAGHGVAAYRDPRPGRYWFRVAACRPGGDPTGDEAGLALELIVPWYRRPASWLGAAVAVAAIVAAIVRTLAMRRIRRRLEEVERAHALERERTRIARDLHDEVGAGLTEIAMQNFWVAREMEGKAPAATLHRVERARQSAIDLVRSVDAIVWAVNPANDTLDRFVPYLTHSFEQFVEASGIRPRLDVPEEFPGTAIVGATRHSLFLVVREAANNAVKHARPTSIGLAIRLEDGILRIEVDDDGCGIDPRTAERAAGDPGARSGLVNIRRRVADLGGRCTIGGRAGGGTVVAIDVPLSAARTSPVP